jgi:DNA-binding response OmpR family regulator
MVTLVLSRFGYQVDAVEDGERAWQSLGNGAYRLLITDHNMPKLSGLELVGKMRTAGMGLAVISISGTLTEDDVDAYRGLGVEALLPKPFLPRELVELVDATLFGLRRRV